MAAGPLAENMKKKSTKFEIYAILFAACLASPAGASEGLQEYRFQDGVQVKVHFKDPASEEFASSVLDAAVSAYQTLTDFQGFNSKGYSFSSPDYRYAYDPDKTIDVYLGRPEDEDAFEELGEKNKLFKDAPCFDTRQTGSERYEAMIFLPSNYEEFIRNWEKLNPSSLGKRNIHVDLRGTLIHEMTHVILFYYNRNLDKSGEMAVPGRHLDWYVEGLARYFETFAGARHDFFSQGFKQTLPDKIRFSRGGSNYFMRYPDQAFTELRYENALFWRFIDMRFGMPAIEELSRHLRGRGADFKKALEEVTGEDFNSLLSQYASAILLGDFNLKEDSAYLNGIATTRLWLEGGDLYLRDGYDGKRFLGAICRTDWIGSWEDARAAFGEAPVAGDATDAADVSAWATDYAEVRFADQSKTPELFLRHTGQGLPISMQLFAFTKGGSVLRIQPFAVARGSEAKLCLPSWLSDRSLRLSDIERLVIAVTNTDPKESASYELRVQE